MYGYLVKGVNWDCCFHCRRNRFGNVGDFRYC